MDNLFDDNLLSEIFKFLKVEDLITITLVCTTFHRVVFTKLRETIYVNHLYHTVKAYQVCDVEKPNEKVELYIHKQIINSYGRLQLRCQTLIDLPNVVGHGRIEFEVVARSCEMHRLLGHKSTFYIPYDVVLNDDTKQLNFSYKEHVGKVEHLREQKKGKGNKRQKTTDAVPICLFRDPMIHTYAAKRMFTVSYHFFFQK